MIISKRKKSFYTNNYIDGPIKCGELHKNTSSNVHCNHFSKYSIKFYCKPIKSGVNKPVGR